eukprot:s94_g35.t3
MSKLIPWEDLVQISALDSGDLLTAQDIWSAISELRAPAFSFHDLQRPFCFRIFQLLGRFTFACYSDASGVMTLHEFQCAVHKMVDLALELHSQTAESTGEVRAAAVRELTSIVVPGLFRVLDFDQSGDIGTHEFIRGALLLLATVQGAPLDTPQLADLAFRVVDADGDGLVTVAELKKWVTLALEHEVVDKELQFLGGLRDVDADDAPLSEWLPAKKEAVPMKEHFSKVTAASSSKAPPAKRATAPLPHRTSADCHAQYRETQRKRAAAFCRLHMRRNTGKDCPKDHGERTRRNGAAESVPGDQEHRAPDHVEGRATWHERGSTGGVQAHPELFGKGLITDHVTEKTSRPSLQKSLVLCLHWSHVLVYRVYREVGVWLSAPDRLYLPDLDFLSFDSAS